MLTSSIMYYLSNSMEGIEREKAREVRISRKKGYLSVKHMRVSATAHECEEIYLLLTILQRHLSRVSDGE